MATSLPELLRALSAAQASADEHRLRAARGRLARALRDELPRDPLVAASCAAVVGDDDLRARLLDLAAELTPQIGRAKALVTDGQGQGQVVEVLVELSPGGTGTWTAQDVERDALVAAQLAAAVALGPQTEHYGVRWQVKGAGAVRGSSLGLAVAVATRAAQRGLAVPDDQAFTGGVDLDGTVATVHGIPAKLRAARAAGVAQVTVPAADLPGLRLPEGLAVQGADAVAPVLEGLFGVPDLPAATPRARWRAGALLIPVLAAWTGMLDPVDGLLQAPAARAVLGELAATWTVVLPLPDTPDTRALRVEYPRVLAALADAGAAAVVVDITLGAETGHDAALTEAVIAATQAGTPVILPVLRRDDQWQGPGDPDLAAAGVPGVIELEADLLFGRVRRAPALLRISDGSTRWHATVHALSALVDGSPEVTDRMLQVGVTRTPLSAERIWLPPVAAPPRLDWQHPGVGAGGKVVLLGRATGPGDRFRTPGGLRYGVEIHAALVETLAAQAGLRRGSAALDAALAAGVAALTAMLGMALPRRRRWLALGVSLAALGGGLLALGAGWLVAPSPLLLAGFVAWWVVR